MVRRIFHSKILVLSLIFSFIFLLTTEAAPRKVDIDSNEEFKPVVRVKESGEEIPAGQKDRFERLIEEGIKLFQEEMDPEGAIKKFKEAEGLAITRLQKADVYFYLSLAYYTTLEERRAGEFDETIRKLIEIDYYRELDKLLCPPRYIELFEGIRKEYGILRVQSKPAGADVYLGDRRDSVGKTPLTIGAKAGSVKIRIKKGKKEKKEILNVIAGKETTSPIIILKGGSGIMLALGGIALAGAAGAALLLKSEAGEGPGPTPTPTTGSIQVNSTPTGARVYLDGTDTGQTTNCTLSNVSPGSHTVRLVKEAHEDYEENISVTAGQTTSINANLTRNTITVTNPTSSAIWIKGEAVDIRWVTSGSASLQASANTRTGSNPLPYPGRNLSSPFQRGVFQHERSFPRLMSTRRGLESVESSKRTWTHLKEKTGINSSKLSKYQDVSKKFSSLAKEGNTIHKRARNIGIAKRNNSFRRINLTVVPGVSFNSPMHSAHIKKQSRNMKVLAITNVKIELYKGGSLEQTIVSSTENDGTYTWTEVNPFLQNGIDYKIRVSCATDSEVYDESDEFRIEEMSITVVEPTSSTIWSQGNSADITWTTKGAINNVKIDLYKGNTFEETIISSTENDGTYTWTEVNPSLQDGIDYKVRISSTSDPGTYDESDEFRIEEMSITVVEPTSSTIWSKGNSADITWTTKGAINNVKIDLYKGNTFEETIISSTENDGTYTWTAVTPSLQDGIDYKVRISSTSDPGTYDESDEFQISQPGYIFVLKWGSEGSADGQFEDPQGIAVDSSGYVYVADTWNDRIQKFSSSGSFVTKWGSYGNGDGQFSNPEGIAVDSSGYVYVADTWNNRIQKFSSSGAFVTKWGSYGSGDGQFDWPMGIAVDSSGYVYVVDNWNNRIQKFSSSGSFVTKWGSTGSGDGQFSWPEGIAVDSSGYVYVADTWNDRIQKFSSSGIFVTKWGSYGSGDGQFNYPEGIAADNSGYVYVADTWNDRVQKFSSSGSFVTKWGSTGSGDGQFNQPQGIAVDNSGYVYVVDTDNHRIQKFQFVSATLGLTRNNYKILDNNFSINKNSTRKFHNIKSPLHNRLKNKKSR